MSVFDSMLERIRRENKVDVYTAGGEEVLVKDVPELQVYIDALANDEVADISFNVARPNGDLAVTDDNGVTIVMKNEDLNGRGYNSFYRSQKVGVPYTVNILSIDKDTKTVYVSAEQMHKAMQRNYQRGMVIGEIERRLASLGENEKLILPAKVIRVNDHDVRLSILNSGVICRVNIANWSHGYVRDIHRMVTLDAWHEVEILKRADWVDAEKRNHVLYEASRKDTSVNPWDINLEEKYPVGTVVEVRCAERPQEKTGGLKSYYWGVLKGLENLEVMCRYPSSRKEIEIIPDKSYKCKVVRVEPENRIFVCSTFEETKESVNKFLFRSRKNRNGQ